MYIKYCASPPEPSCLYCLCELKLQFWYFQKNPEGRIKLLAHFKGAVSDSGERQLTVESHSQVVKYVSVFVLALCFYLCQPLYAVCVFVHIVCVCTHTQQHSSFPAMHIGPALKWKSACAPLNPSPAAKHIVIRAGLM